MTQERAGNLYYIDYVQSGGVVHNRPTKLVPELVLVGARKSELETEFEEKTRDIKGNLGKLAYMTRQLHMTEFIMRRELLKATLPTPGFINLEGSYYTGWFYIKLEDDQIFSMYGGKKGDIEPYNVAAHSPYFLLTEKEAEHLNKRVQEGPLSRDEGKELSRLPSLESHPLLKNLTGISLHDYVSQTGQFIDDWHNKEELIYGMDDKEEVAGQIREKLLRMKLAQMTSNRMHRTVVDEIKIQMEKDDGFTVFPLGQEGALVCFTTNKGISYKTLPLPSKYIRLFQRYRRLGEKPMSQEEFSHLYNGLIDPYRRFSKDS